MITAAVLCPAAPLMAAELTGDDPDAAAVRAAALDAVAWLVATGADVIAVVAAASSAGRSWPATGRADLAPYGGPRLPDDVPPVPLGVGIGARLLDSAGHSGDRLMWTVDPSSPDTLATTLAAAADRVGLLVLAEGSAHRNLKTSTDLAARAEKFDAAVAQSIMDGDLSSLASLDPTDLMVTWFPALRVLSAALPDASSTSLRYCAAPFGVGYFVATLLGPPTRRT